VANYVKATNFAAKDALVTTDPAKIIKGTEIDNEYNAIASAVSSKADSNSPTLTGTPLAPTAAPGTNTTQIATTAFVAAAAGNAANIQGGGANRVVFQSAIDTTSFAVAPTVAGTYLGWTGSAFAWSTVSASTSAALTMNNSGTGDSSGATFNGSIAKTISYNTIGAPSTSGTGATGTWGINITGSSGSTSYATSAGSATTASSATTAAGLTGSPAITVSSVSSSGNVVAYPSSSNYSALQSQSIALFNANTGMSCDGTTFSWQFSSALRMQLNSSGQAFNTTGTWGTISDARIKENVTPARSYLNDVCQLEVVTYNLKDEPQKMLGFVAQQVETVMPGLVDTSDNKYYNIADFKSVKTSVLVPMLVQAIQELKAEIDALKNA